jgi:type III secretion system HrpE/YscL family protein
MMPGSSRPSGGVGGAPPSGYGRSGPVSVAAPPASKKAIIEREVVDATSEARRILTDAEDEARRIVDEAQRQAEELRQRGYDDGYQEGLGRYTEETTRALRQVDQLKAGLEPEYVKLVRVCVEKVLGQELKTNPDAVIGIVRNALRSATQQREIIVRIHPDDAEHLRKNQRRLLDVLARASGIEVRDDAAIQRGGCVVLTELGTIDASLERQLQAIEDALQDELAQGPAEDAPAEDAGGEAYDEGYGGYEEG